GRQRVVQVIPLWIKTGREGAHLGVVHRGLPEIEMPVDGEVLVVQRRRLAGAGSPHGPIGYRRAGAVETSAVANTGSSRAACGAAADVRNTKVRYAQNRKTVPIARPRNFA